MNSVTMKARNEFWRLHISAACFILASASFSHCDVVSTPKITNLMEQNQLSTNTPRPYCLYPPLTPKLPSPPFPIENPPPKQVPSPQYNAPSSPKTMPRPDHAIWCVAKPTSPPKLIQVALDYACGSGADCEPVRLNGLCFLPDTVLSHASYAFNSYWQKTKLAGGTCDFGGTAMLVTVDPSYDKCHFVYG